MKKKLIQFKNIVKSYEDGKVVLKGIDLDIYENEFVTLLGPSGCGKTTLLRILGGFLQADQGEVLFDGQEISKLPPYKREINTVFQKYALFPHMNVYDNIAFGLKLKKEPKDIIEQKVKRMLKLVNLEEFADRSVTAMSGGQQQRIAIARALVNEPSVLLLDEPLGALDLKLRKEMQQELKKIQQEVGITFIYVTHDQEEALTMSDKIVVMREGEIQQIGSPTDIYNEPVNEFVANFIGESNIIEGMMVDDYKVVFEGRRFDCVDNGFGKNEVVDVVIRPEDLDIVPRGEGKLKGVVKSVLFKGVHYETMVETKVGTEITVKMAVSNDSPVYNEAANEKMSANDFYLDMEDVEDDAANYFIPYAHLRFDLGGGGFVPYVELDGTLKHNDMRELMETNLYYVPRYTDPMPRNTVDYSVRVGVSGRLVEDKLIYRLFVGYSFIENHNFWYCYTPTTRYEGFSLVQGRLNVMSLNGELEFRPVSNFTFSIGGRGLTYTEHQTLSIGLPEFEGTVRARYHHRKFSVGLVFDLQSNRYISRVIPWFPNDGIVGNMRIPYTVDLGLNVDWYASKRVTVFAEGHNLCNRRIYDWSTFPQYSAGFTAGVKLSF